MSCGQHIPAAAVKKTPNQQQHPISLPNYGLINATPLEGREKVTHNLHLTEPKEESRDREQSEALASTQPGMRHPSPPIAPSVCVCVYVCAQNENTLFAVVLMRE